MFTDAPPRRANRAGFLESDRIKTLHLPPNGDLQEIAQRLESAMKADNIRDVRSACTAFLESASKFYEVPLCGVRVLAARPLRTREHGTFELFGDYTPEPMLIRVWMRTAVRKEVTSFGTFLSTLCHEFCHHLDFKKFGFADSWHTRGFFERAAVLYHYAKGTPFKKLFWVPSAGGRWRIDWQRTNRAELGRLSVQTLRSSSSIASNAGSTLSSSSMSRTQGFSFSRALSNGPALKNCLLCSSYFRDSQSTLLAFARSSTQRLGSLTKAG